MTRLDQCAAGSTLLAFLLIGAIHAQEPAPSTDGFDFTGLDVVSRIVEHTYPMSDAPDVTIVNRFGPVVVETWDDPVVHLKITIRVGAATEEAAVRTAQLIDVVSKHETDRLDIRTTFPPAQPQEQGGFSVEYAVQAPRQTRLTVENTFGDTRISGVQGGVQLESRYGVIALSDVGGSVQVRSRGEFPLTADGLKNGGFFHLRGTQATFSDIEGSLRVSNYLGSVSLHPSTAQEASITAESGPVHVYLPDGPAPSLHVRSDFGRIESEVVLQRESWGRSETAVFESPNAPQRIDVHAAFDNVYIHRPPSLVAAAPGPAPSELVQDEIVRTMDLGADRVIRIDAAPGTVVVEGVSESQVSVVARRHARVGDIANARLALEGLSLRIEDEPEALRVMTLVRENMQALGVTEHGVNLTVRCPADATVELYTDTGETRVVRLSGRVRAEHGTGTLTASELSGEATLSVARGSAIVTQSTGAVTVSTRGGDARVERVSGDLSIAVTDGRTVVDSPGAGVTVEATNGDVRIVALEGINGDFDVRVDRGNISLAAPETASATFILNATDGMVRSALPVTGSMEGTAYRFQGRLNDGTHRVVLETQGGDIRVD